MTLSKKVKIVEVGPRDGLQNEKTPLSVEDKVALINRLTDAGLPVIESGAFVSPKWVPQMADTDKVLAAIDYKDGVSYPVLVPNERGMADAMAAGVKEIAVFAAASESFSKKNINCSIDDSLARFAPVIETARANNILVRGYVSCVMGCPYEGAVKPDAVADVSKKLFAMGCYEISLGDTIGVGVPDQTRRVLHAVASRVPIEHLAAHFHDTGGRALDNLDVALDMGVRTIDASVGGLGGCPYADGASGNVATEDVIDMLHKADFVTGCDLSKIIETARWIFSKLSREPQSRLTHLD